MSRAFVIEGDEWFTCFKMERRCKDANLRGRCTLNKCKYETEKTKRSSEREEKN